MLVLAESELSNMMASSESSLVPVSSQCTGVLNMGTSMCSDYPHSPSSSTPAQLHSQPPGIPCTPMSPRGPYQNHHWDINDSTLPVSDAHDPFELWPSGHYRRVYRGDSDDARRHVSGWAMRNTNNHNALILKKSCLGVLVCSLDCLLESGRKVHLRPAICDKARRKQIGKPCLNPGCQGKLTLLSCRGHCGYPVTHFWRHVNNSVFFQAKGYHDHPRPEVKSLSDKGRHAFSKQLRQDGDRVLSMPIKRRYPLTGNDDGPDRKVYIHADDDVMCSCPPFECVCPKSSMQKNSFMPSTFGYIRDSPSHTFMPHRSPPGTGLGMQQLSHGPFTQINITNTCLPPSSLDVGIPSIEIYKNCSKFGTHGFYHDNDMKIFRHGENDCMSNSLNHSQHMTRSPIDDLRSPQMLNCASSAGFQHINCPPRNFNSSSSSHPANVYGTDGRDDYSRYRMNPGQYYIKGRGIPASGDERSQTLGLSLKTEPSEPVFTDIPSSPHGVQSRSYQNEALYNTMSPNFTTDPMLSPRIVDCQTKYERSTNVATKDQQDQQEGAQELTYITLTSPPRQNESRQNHREFHSCRLGHVNRSPNTISSSSLENVIFPSLSHQPGRIDHNETEHSPLSTVSPRNKDSREETLTPSSSVPPRQSSPSMPRLLLSDDTLNQQGNTGRNSNIYPPFNSYHDPSSSSVPFSLTSDGHMGPYQPGSSGFGSNPIVPYGYYCNDMFSNATQQNYRNRSINITLTYN